MKAVVKKIIGPYEGPYSQKVVTYMLQTADGLIAWHNTGNKPLIGAKIGVVYTGIKTRKYKGKTIIDYKKSKPINTQLKLF